MSAEAVLAVNTQDMEVFARRWGYGYADHQSLGRGEVFKLHGLIADEKLLRLGYVAEVPRGQHIYECGCCPRRFIGLAELNAHGDACHKFRFESPNMIPVETQYKGKDVTVYVDAGEDSNIKSEEVKADQVAPLYLDKTSAARQADNAIVVQPERQQRTKKKRGG